MLQARKKMFFVRVGRRGRGFTLVELMVTIAILAIILAIAVPNFSAHIQFGRTEGAAQGLARTVANARAIASQTGRRTTLTINGSVTGCDAAAWAVTQGANVLGCLTRADFASRYQGASLSGEPNTINFSPAGIASNDEMSYTFTSGSSSKKLRINAGGAVEIDPKS